MSWVETPAHRRAYHCVNKAIASGVLVRPASCEECGAGGKIEAHHADHSQPLAVVWLCKRCHEMANRNSIKVGAGGPPMASPGEPQKPASETYYPRMARTIDIRIKASPEELAALQDGAATLAFQGNVAASLRTLGLAVAGDHEATIRVAPFLRDFRARLAALDQEGR